MHSLFRINVFLLGKVLVDQPQGGYYTSMLTIFATKIVNRSELYAVLLLLIF